VVKSEAEAEIVRITLDDVCASLFAKTGIELRQSLSDQLMPLPDASAQA
jgi:hypothetical protein